VGFKVPWKVQEKRLIVELFISHLDQKRQFQPELLVGDDSILLAGLPNLEENDTPYTVDQHTYKCTVHTCAYTVEFTPVQVF